VAHGEVVGDGADAEDANEQAHEGHEERGVDSEVMSLCNHVMEAHKDAQHMREDVEQLAAHLGQLQQQTKLLVTRLGEMPM